MNKTINNLIASLGIVAVLAFVIIIAIPTKAQAICYYEQDCSSGSSSYPYDTTTNSSTSGNPIPIIYNVTPNSVIANSTVGNMAVILTGANFVPGSLAEWNNTYRPTNYNDPGHLTVILNASDLSVTGSYVITVFSPMPGGGSSNGVYFNVISSTQAAVNASNASTGNTSTSTYVSPAPSSPSYYTNNNTTGGASTAPASTTYVPPSTPPQTGTLTGTGTNNGLTNAASNSSLSASALFGTNSFLPSTFLGWLLTLILMILAIILIRKAFFAEKYKNTPLKHA